MTDSQTLIQRTLPGFANVHSHAFQRLLRGEVQRRNPHTEDTFWTWREAMYAQANQLSIDDIEAAARLCYIECLEAGYTAIGEFHYLHHDLGGKPFSDPIATSKAMLRAAEQTGIRLCLLWTVYAQGGFGLPLSPQQVRFQTRHLDDVKHALDRLMPLVDGKRTNIGLAIHSVRAVPTDWLGPLASEARQRNIPLHCHVSEQPDEVDACLEHTQMRPMALLDSQGVLGENFTAIHATWLDENDLNLMAQSGCRVCICPTTEGDLGDGIPKTAEMWALGIPLCIGSDSHVVIDPFSELRSLEFQARAVTGRRCVLISDNGDVAPALIGIAHQRGYEALNLKSEGDSLIIDPHARSLQQCSDWKSAILVGGHPGLIQTVMIGGETLVENGRHVGF